MSSGNLDRLGATDFSFVRENIGEVDRQRLLVDSCDHLFARLYLDQLLAGLADLMVKRITVTLLDNNFGSWETGDVGISRNDARLKILRHHARIANHDCRCRSASDQPGITRGRLA